MRFPAGLYQIRNLKNGRTYIDINSNLDAIWNRHQAQLRFGSHPNADLQRDWIEQGASTFLFEILELIDTDDLTVSQINHDLKLLKSLYLDTVDKGSLYNIDG